MTTSIQPTLIIGDLLTYNQIERGTIMMFTLALLAVTINIGIQFARGALDKNLLYREKRAAPRAQPNPSPPSGEDLVKGSTISVNKIGMVTRSNVRKNTGQSEIRPPVQATDVEDGEEEGICNKIQKVINRFNWCYSIVTIILLNLITGTNFPFSFTLYFIVLAFLIVFNAVRIHRKCCEVPILWVILESLFLLAAMFWALNHWTTAVRNRQAYFMLQTSNTL